MANRQLHPESLGSIAIVDFASYDATASMDYSYKCHEDVHVLGRSQHLGEITPTDQIKRK